MRLYELPVGAKITIHSQNWRICRTEPSAITTIVSISARVLKTEDGNRWHPKRGTQLDQNGRESKGPTRIYPYRDGDDVVVRKAALVDKCWRFLSPNYDNDGPMQNVELLTEEDWTMLAEISKRYAMALAAKNAPSSDKAEVGDA